MGKEGREDMREENGRLKRMEGEEKSGKRGARGSKRNEIQKEGNR